MLGGNKTFLILFTSLALLVLTAYLVFRMPASRLEYAAWTLVLAGGIGNLIDRVANGAVVDFWNVLFMNFAIFNFADVLVTVGVCLLILYLIQVELREHRRKADGDGMQQLEFVVPQEACDQRLDSYLAAQEETGLSRSALQQLVKDGKVLCNGKPAAKNARLRPGADPHFGDPGPAAGGSRCPEYSAGHCVRRRGSSGSQ